MWDFFELKKNKSQVKLFIYKELYLLLGVHVCWVCDYEMMIFVAGMHTCCRTGSYCSRVVAVWWWWWCVCCFGSGRCSNHIYLCVSASDGENEDGGTADDEEDERLEKRRANVKVFERSLTNHIRGMAQLAEYWYRCKAICFLITLWA